MFENRGVESSGRYNTERMEEMVKSFSRKDVENFRVPILEQNIVLPKVFYKAMVDFTKNTDRENRGAMLVDERESDGNKFYIVKYMVTCGYGSEGSVFPDKKNIQALTQMMKKYRPDGKLIEYHAHPEKLGQYWWNHFSDGDFNTIGGMLERNLDYIHVLFTPTNILTLSEKETAFRLAPAKDQNTEAIVWKDFNKWRGRFSTFLQ